MTEYKKDKSISKLETRNFIEATDKRRKRHNEDLYFSFDE